SPRRRTRDRAGRVVQADPSLLIVSKARRKQRDMAVKYTGAGADYRLPITERVGQPATRRKSETATDRLAGHTPPEVYGQAAGQRPVVLGKFGNFLAGGL